MKLTFQEYVQCLVIVIAIVLASIPVVRCAIATDWLHDSIEVIQKRCSCDPSQDYATPTPQGVPECC